jgi:hypothetical protein
MTTARASQFVGVAVVAEGTPKPQISQLVMVAVVSGTINYISLDNPIALPCWQPCSSFGTFGKVFYYAER